MHDLTSALQKGILEDSSAFIKPLKDQLEDITISLIQGTPTAEFTTELELTVQEEVLSLQTSETEMDDKIITL